MSSSSIKSAETPHTNLCFFKQLGVIRSTTCRNTSHEFVFLQTTRSHPFYTSPPSVQTTTSCSRVHLTGFVFLSLSLHLRALEKAGSSCTFYTLQAATRTWAVWRRHPLHAAASPALPICLAVYSVGSPPSFLRIGRGSAAPLSFYGVHKGGLHSPLLPGSPAMPAPNAPLLTHTGTSPRQGRRLLPQHP
jgi:hypothetical protein